VDIGPDETTGAVYFNKLYAMGVEALGEAVDLIAAGKAPRIPQDHSKATYEPPCDDKVAGLNWEQPGQVIYNFIRGCDPQPGATTSFRGEMVKFFNTAFKPQAHTVTSGEILEVASPGLTVAVTGGALVISRLRTKDLGKVKAQEFIQAKAPKVGEKFGS
jgi:methionyl-tRNA formyltransferase